MTDPQRQSPRLNSVVSLSTRLHSSATLYALVVIVLAFAIAAPHGAEAQEPRNSHGSSWYIAGGYGWPFDVRTEAGYVFGTVASVGVMFAAPVSSFDVFAISVGGTARWFVPISTRRVIPFVSAAYASTAVPLESSQTLVSLTAGTLVALVSGVYVRGELGAGMRDEGSSVTNGAPSSSTASTSWHLSWCLQFEFELDNLPRE